MKKRVLLTISLLIVFSTLFVFVNAATSPIVVDNYKRSTTSNNGVNIEVSGVQLKPYTDGYVYQTSSTQTSINNSYQVILTTTVTNTTSTNKYINNFYVQPTFNDSELGTGISLAQFSQVNEIQCFGPDFDMSINYTNGYLATVTHAEYSYIGYLCVPAYSTLSCIFVMEMPVTSTIVSGGGTIREVDLNGVSVSNWTAIDTSYQPGGGSASVANAINQLKDYLMGQSGIPEIISNQEEINQNVEDIEAVVSNINSLVNSIKSILTWSGTYNNPSFGLIDSYTKDVDNGTRVIVRSYGGIPITDFEAVPPNTIISDVLYKIPVSIEINTNYSAERKISNGFAVMGAFNDAGVSFDIPQIQSTWIQTVGVAHSSNKYNFYIKSDNDIIPDGNRTSVIWFYVYSRSATLYINSQFTVDLVTNSYESDIETQSDTLVNQSNQAHQQEQAFFNQNSQAIANTGLGNFQFSSDQSSGISVVTGLFNRLWNSVGSWNTVYVFSLTITVALTILRYTTNAIRRRSYTEDKGGKP